MNSGFAYIFFICIHFVLSENKRVPHGMTDSAFIYKYEYGLLVHVYYHDVQTERQLHSHKSHPL